MTKNVLLTGATGYIGAFLLNYFFDNLDGRTFAPLRSEKWPKARIDVVVHCAAAAGNWNTNKDILRDNIDYMADVVAFAKRRGAYFIFMSSISIYGEVREPILDEQTPTFNPDFYGKSKLFGECLLELHEDYFPSISLRLPGVVGSAMSKRRNFLARVLREIKEDKVVEAMHLDSIFNNVVHLKDLADFVLYLINHPTKGVERAVLGSLGIPTVRGTIELLAREYNKEVRLRETKTDRRPYRIEFSHARDLGYSSTSVGEVLWRIAQENPL